MQAWFNAGASPTTEIALWRRRSRQVLPSIEAA